MAQLTDLNVSPYYDDFDKNDNFQKVLFRPGFAVQARELTTLQSILADQIESQGKFVLKRVLLLSLATCLFKMNISLYNLLQHLLVRILF